MTDNMVLERFKESLFYLLDETFETHRGLYLDPGDSLFPTLATISAAEASQPVSASCASIAAQVAHVRFYLEVLAEMMQGRQPAERPDWGHIWRTVQAVTPAEWAESQAQLRATYERVRQQMAAIEGWEGRFEMGAALGIVVHTAYHLGEIRQALCTIKGGS